jgi:hypothetical protein
MYHHDCNINVPTISSACSMCSVYRPRDIPTRIKHVAVAHNWTVVPKEIPVCVQIYDKMRGKLFLQSVDSKGLQIYMNTICKWLPA